MPPPSQLVETTGLPRARPLARKTVWTKPLDHELYVLLKAEGPLTRDELVAHTGVARTTLYDALMRLNVRGLIGKLKLPRETRGRCRVAFDVIRS